MIVPPDIEFHEPMNRSWTPRFRPIHWTNVSIDTKVWD